MFSSIQEIVAQNLCAIQRPARSVEFYESDGSRETHFQSKLNTFIFSFSKKIITSELK